MGTRKFLLANRRNRQTKMKAWEFCEEGQRCNDAIREIKKDLYGRLIDFGKVDDYWILLGLEMKKFSNGASEYWRCVPNWEHIYLSYNDKNALDQLRSGTYQDGKRAGGKEYDDYIKRVYHLLEKGIVQLN